MLEIIRLLKQEVVRQGGEESDLDLLLSHHGSLEAVVKVIMREADVHFRGIFTLSVPKKPLALGDLVLETGIGWVCPKLETSEVMDILSAEQEALRGIASFRTKVCRVAVQMTTGDILSSMNPDIYEPVKLIDLFLLKMQFGSYLGKMRMVALGTEIGDLVPMTSYLANQGIYELSSIRKQKTWPKDTCFPFRLKKEGIPVTEK